MTKFMRRVLLAGLIMSLLGLAADKASATPHRPRHHEVIRKSPPVKVPDTSADELEDVRDSLQNRLDHVRPGSPAAERLQDQIDELDELVDELGDDDSPSMDSDEDDPS